MHAALRVPKLFGEANAGGRLGKSLAFGSDFKTSATACREAKTDRLQAIARLLQELAQMLIGGLSQIRYSLASLASRFFNAILVVVTAFMRSSRKNPMNRVTTN